MTMTQLARSTNARRSMAAVVVVAATVAAIFLATRRTQAVDVPDFIRVQGFLTDPDGDPIAPGPYNVRAVIFATADDTTEICNWLETGVLAHEGNLGIDLGGASGIGTCARLAEMLQGRGPVWVELSVQSGSSAFETLAPRIPVLPAPRVHHAQVTERLGDALARNLVPSGAVAFFETSCPAGWERATEYDGVFPRGAAIVGGTGGSLTSGAAGDGHTHSTTTGGGHGHGLHADGHHAHGVACGSTLGVGLICGGWGSGCGCERLGGTDAQGSHGHTAIGVGDHTHTTQAASSHTHNYSPPYGDMIFCRKL